MIFRSAFQIRIWMILLLGLVVRLPNLDAPIIGTHAWRQADTAAMARNFAEYDQSILYPRVDWGGGAVVESEFPLYQWTVSLFYRLFGVQEIFGRSLSIIASLLMLFYFYRLVLYLSNESTALWSTFVLAVLPLQVFYGRAFMPDMTMMMFAVAGIYYFVRWVREDTLYLLFLSCVAITFSALIKLPALHVGFLFLFILWRKQRFGFLANPWLWGYAIVSLSAVALWYLHAHSNYTSGGVTFGIWEYGSDKWGNWQMLIEPQYWNKILFQSIAERHLTWLGFVVFLVGLFSRRISDQEELFRAWLVAVVVYFVVVTKGNFVHEYYQLPFIPAASFFIGKTFASKLSAAEPSRIQRNTLAIALVGMLVIGGFRLYSYFSLENPAESVHHQLAQAVAANSQPTEQILLIGDHNPAVLYLAHRKGWAVSHSALRSDSFNSRLAAPPTRLIAGMFSDIPDTVKSDWRAFLQSKDSICITSDFFVVGQRP